MTTAGTRPRSPDVQIYKPQLTSVLSIPHRISGAALSVGSVLLVGWLVAVVYGGDTHAMVDHWLHSWIGSILLLGWTFALFHHLCNGSRHLAWDPDFGFELRNIYLSGRTVLAISAMLALVTWTLGLTVVE